MRINVSAGVESTRLTQRGSSCLGGSVIANGGFPSRYFIFRLPGGHAHAVYDAYYDDEKKNVDTTRQVLITHLNCAIRRR